MDLKINNIDPSSLAISQLTNLPQSEIKKYVEKAQKEGNPAFDDLANVLMEANKSEDQAMKEQLSSLLAIDYELAQIEREIQLLQEDSENAMAQSEMILERLNELKSMLDEIEKKLLDMEEANRNNRISNDAFEARMLELYRLRKQLEKQETPSEEPVAQSADE